MKEVKKMLWEPKYSVEIEIIDHQHQRMFEIINKLVAIVGTVPPEEKLQEIVDEIVAYKTYHFTTEEKYFHDFNYENTEKHEAAHRTYDKIFHDIYDKNKNDVITLSFKLVDFLEDWWVNHIMIVDHQYIKTFKEHGLK